MSKKKSKSKTKTTTNKNLKTQSLSNENGIVAKQSPKPEKTTEMVKTSEGYTPQLDEASLIRQRLEALNKEREKLEKEIKNKERECALVKRKYENDEKSILGSINKFEHDIEQKQKEKARIGQDDDNVKENESSLNVFNKNSTKRMAKDSFTIPDDLAPLPKIGILYDVQGTKYLEIAFWEEYQTGQEECKRFNAQLCAQEHP